MSEKSLYLIDWMTLRISLGERLGQALSDRIRSCMNTIHCVNSDGEIVWAKKALDIDALRSDTTGICWMVQSDGIAEYLVIGASPASLEHGLNVFGSCDVQHCAEVLIRAASKALDSVLPGMWFWQCRRMDITGNYVLPDEASVRQALRQLALADGGRRKATNKNRGGDTVYWNPSSDLRKGKAYHKGPQMAFLRKKNKLETTDELIELANRLLRLEHTLGAKWFRRLRDAQRNWFDLQTEELERLFVDFFGRVVDGVEVRDMGIAFVEQIEKLNACTESQAQAAFNTYTNIRTYGFETMKGQMHPRTWYRHLSLLRVAGVSDADLQMGNVVQFRPIRIVLAQPVMCWDDIRRAA